MTRYLKTLIPKLFGYSVLGATGYLMLLMLPIMYLDSALSPVTLNSYSSDIHREWISYRSRIVVKRFVIYESSNSVTALSRPKRNPPARISRVVEAYDSASNISGQQYSNLIVNEYGFGFPIYARSAAFLNGNLVVFSNTHLANPKFAVYWINLFAVSLMSGCAIWLFRYSALRCFRRRQR